MSLLNKLKHLAVFAVGTLMTTVAVGVKLLRDLAEEIEGPGARMAKRYKAGFAAFFDAIRDTNDQIDDLRNKWRRDGGLNEYDRATFEALRERRTATFIDLSEARVVHLASEVRQDSTAFGDLSITDSNPQVMQFHAGQTVTGKTCRVCERPMILQWRREGSVGSARDFFWGCSGYYHNKACRRKEPFDALDRSLFTKVDRQEFTIQPQALDAIAESHEDHVVKRMGEVVDVENATYCCPIHHEPMRLYRKRSDAKGLLDLYSYRCSRCGYLQKLKSAAQLSAALETGTGRGLL